MAKKRNSLSDFEVSIIKSLLNYSPKFQNQEITGMINRSRGVASNDISTGRISNIKNDQIKKYVKITPAKASDVDAFLNSYQNIASIQKDDDSDISDFKLAKLLPLKAGSNTHLDITETDVIECKAGWNLPVKTIAAFANNKGGYLVLGVVDKTWEIKGITQAKIDRFDFNQLNQIIRSNLGIEIEVKFRAMDFDGKKVAIFHISQAHTKPVIFSKGGDGIAEGQIFYRYIGEDRLIAASDLNKIIEDRVHKLSEKVLNKHLSNILRIGIENAAIMDLSTGEVEGKAGNFYIDEKVLPQLKFVKEGEFVEKSGSPTLKLVGEVKASGMKVKNVPKDLLKLYPFGWSELRKKILMALPNAKDSEIHKIIKGNKLKTDEKLSHFIFTSAKHEEKYEKTGFLPMNIMSKYNQNTVDFIIEKINDIKN